MYEPLTKRSYECQARTWGFLATDIKDAPACIMGCRDRFWSSLAPENETFADICQALSEESSRRRETILDSVYCCDAQICGVDNLLGSGLDPNVNWLVRNCNGLGFLSIIDPGPPDFKHLCSIDAINRGPTCTTTTSMGPTTSPALTISSSTISTTLTSTIMSTPTMSTTISKSSIQDPSLIASLTGKSNDAGGNLPSDSKITIALTVSVICIAIFVALVFLCYRRSKAQSKSADTRLLQQSTPSPHIQTPVEPLSPLASPAISYTAAEAIPLTPPPRLQDRRFVHSQSDDMSPLQRNRRTGFHVPLNTSKHTASEDTKAGNDSKQQTSPSLSPDFPSLIDSFPPPIWTVNAPSSDEVRPDEIGVATEFPPPHTSHPPNTTQLRPANDSLSSRKQVRSPVLDERDLEMLGGTYRPT